jgi:transposase
MQKSTQVVPFQPQDLIEYRRLRAWFLFLSGWLQIKIAEALGVTQGAVSQWLKRAREKGVEALRRGKAKGARPKLTAEQKAQIPQLLARGASAWGFRGEVWTCERIVEVIQREFKVRYSPEQVGRILKELKWSCQKPERRSRQRDEQAIQKWRDEKWPEIKKKADQEGVTILLADESAFYTLPAVVRTWAPVGQTPLLQEALRYEHVSALSAMTPEGKLYLMSKEESFKAPDVVVFLQHLMELIPGKLLVLWDRGRIHRARIVTEFVARHCARLATDFFPAYAPDLNPDEGVWQYLKYVELRNLCCKTLKEIRHELVQAVKRLRAKPLIIRSFMDRAGLVY